MQAHHNLIYNVTGGLMQWNTQDKHPMDRNATPSRFYNNIFVASRTTPTLDNQGTANGGPKPLFVWNAYVKAEFANNIVAVSSDRSVLFAGTTCLQKHEADGKGACTDSFSGNFAEADFHGNVYWNASGTLAESFPAASGGMQ